MPIDKGIAMAVVESLVQRQLTDEAWMDKGACKGLTYLFFPSAAERPQARERREATAREVCGICPVQLRCREFARDHHEYGFWGGESEDERHAAGFRLIAPIGVRAREAG
jgi:WhiB family redox-sensing transcriptional regulator